MTSSDKTVILITGASSGIGLETVLALSQASPAYEILLGSRSLEKGEKALDDLHSAHGDSLKGAISVVQLGVTDQTSITAARDHVASSHGHLDVLINNAGVIITRPCDTLTSLREHFETNAFGPALVTEAFEPLLKKSKEPRIIYVSSDQGSVTTRLNPTYKWYQMRGDHYRMSKAAVNMLAACHRVNFAEWGCKVAAFNPDFCVTNLSGEERKAFGRENGARDPREPALALVAIVGRERDEEFGENGMMDVDGDVKPW